MSRLKDIAASAISRVEGFFDRAKLRYKWKYDRWKHLQIQPYRGFGTAECLHLRGRVLDDKNVHDVSADQPIWKNARDTIRRIETDEVPGACIRLRFGDQEMEAEADEDGFFNFQIHPNRALPTDRVWHEVTLDLLRPRPHQMDDVRTTGHILVPPPDAEYGVISDMDDTVIRTGATSLFQMVRIVLLNNAHTRVPFAGIAAFYDALRKGPDRRGHNPLFYLSSSPWNLYELFQSFFEAHHIPVGPIFLKDYGFTEDKLFKTGHHTHKLEHIRLLMETYPRLPFVLVGDSGQRDPEIYREVVREHGAERVRAIYIRDVTPEKRNQRDESVEAIAQEVRSSGVPMVLVSTSVDAARHAARHGIIHEEAVRDVHEDQRHEREVTKAPGVLERMIGG